MLRGLVQGWGSESWGVVGIPLVENNKVSRVQRFQVSKFRIRKVSDSKVSDFQNFKSSRHKWMFVGRYWTRITDISFHVFWKILIPYSRFSKTILEGSSGVSSLVFSNICKVADFRNYEISQTYIRWTDSFFFLNHLEYLRPPKINTGNSDVRSHGHVR